MKTGLWLYGPDYCEDGEGGIVAVVESSSKAGRWRMTGIVATADYTTAQAPRDGVDQLVEDIQERHVHRHSGKLKSRGGDRAGRVGDLRLP